MVTSTIRLLVAAAAAAFGAAFAQPASERVATEPSQFLLQRIDELQAEGGLTAEGLIEPLRALGLLYQESGEHELAAVALEQARHVVRANRGLFSASVEEAVLLRLQISSEKALRHGERVWELQQELLTIARQHLDDLRMLPVFLDVIDDRTERLDEFSSTKFAELPPGIYVPCSTDPPERAPYGDKRGARVDVFDARTCPFGTWAVVIARLRSEILTHYAEAIQVIVNNGDYANPELRDLEKQALRLVPFAVSMGCSAGTFEQLLASELVGSCLEPILPIGQAVVANVGGWVGLARLVVYEMRSGAPAAARANALAELADWYLRAEHLDPRRAFSPADDLAVALYQRAHAQLRQGDDAAEAMARIFSPELPVTLPTYVPNPLASTKSSRYVDVAFAITGYGKAERIEVSAKSENATRAQGAELVRLIKSASFRPRAVGGELADSAPVVVRYYLPETPASTAVSAR